MTFTVVDLVLSGASDGASLALLAVAFHLTYSICKTFHLALAGIYTVAPFITLGLLTSGIGYVGSASAAILVAALLSVLCEVANHAPLRRRLASAESHLLASLGVYIVIVQAISMIWGSEPRMLRQGVEPTYAMGGHQIRLTQLISFGTSLLFLSPLLLVIKFTRLGLVTRAFRDNATELALLGYDPGRLRVVFFAIAGGCCALASLVTAVDSGFQVHGGLPTLLLAIVATLSVRSEGMIKPILSAIGLGVARTFVVWLVGARWQDTLSYLLFAVALLSQEAPVRRTLIQARPAE